MKQERKHKINMLPILGITGLLFVALFFLLANFNGDSAESSQHDAYYLFFKLYTKLGYRFKDVSLENLPNPRTGDLMIYFDYSSKPSDIKRFLKIGNWLDRGGTLLVAGVEGSRHPFGFTKSKISAIKTIHIDPSYAVPGRTRIQLDPTLRRNHLKHFTSSSDLAEGRIILNSKAGPLLYQASEDQGWGFVLSDSALLTNAYLRDKNTALFFNRLLAPYYSKRIYLIRQGFSGAGKTVPFLAFLFQDKLLFVSLQLLWILGLFIAWQGKRFGSPQSFDPYARRTLTEHLKAVGHFYQKTHSLRIVDEINLDYFKYMLHKITGFQWKAPPSPEEMKKIAELARDGNISKEHLMEYLQKEPLISSSRLQNKAKNQDRIIKSLLKR